MDATGRRQTAPTPGTGEAAVPEPVTCALCGRPAPADGSWRLTWTSAVERDREQRCCDRCSREHLRSIEARLDPAWW